VTANITQLETKEDINMQRSYLTVRQTAELLQLSESTLNLWRYRGAGPPFLKIGRRVRYDLETVNEWVKSRERHGTFEDTASSAS